MVTQVNVQYWSLLNSTQDAGFGEYIHAPSNTADVACAFVDDGREYPITHLYQYDAYESRCK